MTVLQAYLDESAEPGGVFVMAGYIATADRWERFSSDWAKLLKRFGTLNPGGTGYRFKYSEMTASGTDRRARLPIFQKTILDHAQVGISCRLHKQEILRAQSRIMVGDMKVKWSGKYTSIYYTAYRCIMDFFHHERNKIEGVIPLLAEVDFYFDQQLREQEFIVSAWDDYLSKRPSEIRPLYGSTPRFLSDDVCLPLQAADYCAGSLREAYVSGTIDRHWLASPENATEIIPFIKLEWGEDELVTMFCRILQTETDRYVYDMKSGRNGLQ